MVSVADTRMPTPASESLRRPFRQGAYFRCIDKDFDVAAGALRPASRLSARRLHFCGRDHGFAAQEAKALNTQKLHLVSQAAAATSRNGTTRALGKRSSGSTPWLNWSPAQFAGGQVLYHEGMVPDRVFSLESGIVKEVAHLANGRARTVGLHGPGSVLGLEIPTEESVAHTHTAIAVTPVFARSASSAQVRRMRRDAPEQCLDLIERHCEKLDHAKRWITDFNGDTTTSRIARAIRYLAELQPLDGSDFVELLTCQEMADVVGVSTESASRVLAKFKRMGVLRPVEAGSSSRLYRYDAEAIATLSA